MSYRDRLRKKITLPSGATIVIHKLNSFCDPFTARKKNDNEREDLSLRMMLVNPDNGTFDIGAESFRIVDKPEAGLGEITIKELEQADANFLCQAIIEFSGLDKAGREARNTFPAGQETNDSASSPGEIVPLPSDGSSQAAAG